MTQEDKNLLLRDLCARLPYGVFMGNKEWNRRPYQLTCDEIQYAMMTDDWDDVPYLHPMTSMTEEEKRYIHNKFGATEHGSIETYSFESFEGGHSEVHMVDMTGFIDWLNKKMFDYRGLIGKGLAIEVTEENNPYKEA